MQLALCRSSSLRVLRALRCGLIGSRRGVRCGLVTPVADGRTWTRASLAGRLESVGLGEFSEDDRLEVAVPSAGERIRTKGVSSAVYSGALPRGSFLDIGGGLAISSPEMLFAEMAGRLSIPDLVVLGFELCGTYTLAPDGATLGARGIRPLTSTAKLRSFVSSLERFRGMGRASMVAKLGLDNAWSPMEAVLACLLMLPIEEYGYGLGPLVLNERYDAQGAPLSKGSRVPDIIFAGTSVGLNYDGGSHFGEEDAEGVLDASRYPTEATLGEMVRTLTRRARSQSVADKRRDRDLSVLGLSVLPVTSEDLYEVDGLDKVVRQAIAIIEREGSRDCSAQGQMLMSRPLRRRRQELVWSLLPGRSEQAKRRLQEMEERSFAQAKETITYFEMA